MTTIDKKIKLIYNPYSGNQNFKNRLHECIVQFQEAGYETHVFCYIESGDLERHIADLPQDCYDVIAISGGDGTMSIVVNALLQNSHNIPMLLIPSGTSNDFASSLKIPRDVDKAASLIKGIPIPCDVGLVNGRYFLNVCAAGFMADISQIVNKGLKDSLGNLSYYLTGLGKLTNLTSLQVRVTNSQTSFEEDIYLFLALNSSGIGGLSDFSPNASVDDGLFDFIIVKAVPLLDFTMILMKLLTGEHLDDPNVIYFQDNYVKVEAITENESLMMNTDVDGEAGPQLPIVIENCRHALRIFAPTG